MNEPKPDDRLEDVLGDIRSLLSRSVALQQEAMELDKQESEAVADLARQAGTDTALAQQRTGLAQENTSLVRTQTGLSTRSTELAVIRTDLGHERTSLASQRTDLAALRTDFARARTDLAQQRVCMARARTKLAEKRTMLAVTATVYSKVRTELARGRTYLALVRTGLAFLTLAIFLLRAFGLSWWTTFDATLGMGSLAAAAIGLAGYRRTRSTVRRLDVWTREQEARLPDLEMLKAR